MEGFATTKDFANGKDLISTQHLADTLGKSGVKIVDATWGLTKKNCYENDFLKQRIPGALFFDIDQISDKSTNLPHMLPSVELFEATMEKMGISNSDSVVVYDRSGAFVASARVWWTFKVFGHQSIGILDGGLLKWVSEGRKTESGEPEPIQEKGKYKAQFNKDLVRDLKEMVEMVKSNMEKKTELNQIVDARPAGRFKGVDPEPRQGLKGGHMPTAMNLNNNEILFKRTSTDEFSTFQEPTKMKEILEGKGINLNKAVINTCGSGVTASVNAFALHLMGHTNFSVYDGSWSEWGSLPDSETPTEKSTQ